MAIREKITAASVHVLTASGVIPAFFALLAAFDNRFETAFAWLGVAFVIDGIDGPLARRFGTKTQVPRFCGERLDLIIDYITYVLIPALIVYRADIVPSAFEAAAAIFILLTSLYHFADRDSKTEDGYFVGFPAIWNLVVFYLLAVPVGGVAALFIITVLGLLTFVPAKWLHPVRVRALRPLTFAAMAVWAGAAVFTVATAFPAAPLAAFALLLTGGYAITLGVVRSSLSADPKGGSTLGPA